MRSGKRPLLGRLTASAALAGMISAAGLVAATPAHAAGVLKLERVHCVEETDWIGGDSPYVLVFATSPTYSGATQFGKWGPGSWDGNVDAGDIYYPNGTITGGVQSNWTLWTVLMEEDDGNDLSSGDLNYIETAVYNQWQASFWQAAGPQQFAMTMAFLSAIINVTGNDDIVALRRTSVGVNTSHNGDDGAYWLRFKLV